MDRRKPITLHAIWLAWEHNLGHCHTQDMALYPFQSLELAYSRSLNCGRSSSPIHALAHGSVTQASLILCPVRPVLAWY